MENKGLGKAIVVPKPPPTSIPCRKGGAHQGVPVFEPYIENLPLQSGWYTFVIDAQGRFHVQRGNTRHHGGMINNEPASSAGCFRMSRSGKLAEVACVSTDYPINSVGPGSAALSYVIDAFKHPSFAVSEHVLFRFGKGHIDSFYVDRDGNHVEDREELLKLLEQESIDVGFCNSYKPEQMSRFDRYQGEGPPKLYPLQPDYFVQLLEEEPSERVKDFDKPLQCTDPMPAFSPDQPYPREGKYNFIITARGDLVIGVKGHLLLSGGQPVGAAGHLRFSRLGELVRIDLNFSGHYRPRLDPEYAHYVYRVISHHPLLSLSEACEINGRVFADDCSHTSVLSFSESDLTSHDNRLNDMIECSLWTW